MAFDVGTAIGYLDLDTSGFRSGFNSALMDLEAFGNTTNPVSTRTYALGSAFKTVGSTLTRSFTVPLVGAGAASVAVGNKFESAMSRVQAISGATGDDLKALSDQALELGASTSFSASEAAAGMENLASAGFTVGEIMAAMPGMLDLAASSGSGLATASEIAASAIRGFGLSADSAGHVADVFAEAAARTNAQTEDMGDAMKYVAPVASAMGQSLEETAAAIGIMSDSGIKGSQAGTALRGALSRLAKPTEAMTNVMNDLGLSFFDAEGNMLPLNGIVSELETNMAGLTQQQRNSALVTLFGQESLSGMLALMERGSDELVSLTESFKGVDGAASDMADVMLNNTSGSIEEMLGAIETLAIKVQQVLAPAVTQIVQKITEFISKLGETDEETLKTIVTVAGVVAALGPVLSILGKLLIAIGNLPTALTSIKSAFSVLSGAIGAISAPVLAVIAAVAVLIAAFVNLWKNNEEFRNKITEIWNGIVGMFKDFFAQITEKINSLGFEFENFGEVLKALWQGLCDFLAPVFIGVFQNISLSISTILDVILGIVDFFIAIFKGDWEGAWEAIKGIFESIWNGIVAWFENICETLKGVLDVVCGWFGTTWNETWSNIKSFFVNIWNTIVNFFKNTWDNIKNTVSTALTTTKNIVSSIIEGIKTKISTGFTAAKNTVTNTFNSIKTAISTALNTAKNTVSSVIEKIKGFFKFEWSLPKLKMPHLTITGSFSLSPPSVPKFSIQWYKSAMSKGMILNSPTIFGFDSSTGKFLAGGEAGSETVVGTKSLLRMIKTAVSSSLAELSDTFVQLARIFKGSFDTLLEGFSELLEISKRYSVEVGALGDTWSKQGQGIDYEALASVLTDAFRNAPVQHNVGVEMKDGDVYLDNERVGRKVAPVVSRVISVKG